MEKLREFLKKYVLAIFILLIELVSIIRMGYDTLLVIEGNAFTRWTTAITVDGIMAGSLFYVAYFPNTSEAARTKKYLMSVLAWVMFSVQLVIGFQAGELAGLASRIGMAAILVLHTGTYITQRIRTYRNTHTNTRTPQETRQHARIQAWNIGYKLGSVFLLPFVVLFGVLEQVMLLIVHDMLLRVFTSIQDTDITVDVQTSQSRTLIAHTSRTKRTRNPHNKTYMLTEGDRTGEFMCVCTLCNDELGVYTSQTSASRAFAGHTSNMLHKARAAQDIQHHTEPHIIDN